MTPIGSFFFPFRLPGLNEMLDAKKRKRAAGDAYSVGKRTIEADMVSMIRLANLPRVRGTAVDIRCVWLEPHRRRDPDNICAGVKYVLDGLVRSGVLEDDGWQQVASITHEWVIEKEHPGVEVFLTAREPIATN